MIIESVFVSNKIKQKISTKHNVYEDEIKDTFLYGKPVFRKVAGRYICMGFRRRYLTIIFDYDEKIKQAEIITAYHSSKWQIKLYKKMKR